MADRKTTNALQLSVKAVFTLCCVIVASLAACGGGNDGGPAASSGPTTSDSNEVAQAWTAAAERAVAAMKETAKKEPEIKKLPADEQRAAERQLEAELREQVLKIVSDLPLPVRCESPDLLQVDDHARVSNVTMIVQLHFTLGVTLKEALESYTLIEFRLHSADGSVVAKKQDRVHWLKLSVGEKVAATLDLHWDVHDLTKRAFAYATIRVIDRGSSPAENDARTNSPSNAPAGNRAGTSNRE